MKDSRIITIPNIITIIRIMLVPFFVYMYVGKRDNDIAAVLLLLSLLTDILDGNIARCFDMVSDVGKIIDPVADKLTQFVVIICLCMHYKSFRYLAVFFVLKELVQGILGLMALNKKGQLKSAMWFGKLSTFILYISFLTLIYYTYLPEMIVESILFLCIFILSFSLIHYIRFYTLILLDKK